jgi:hypothetical protein
MPIEHTVRADDKVLIECRNDLLVQHGKDFIEMLRQLVVQ